MRFLRLIGKRPAVPPGMKGTDIMARFTDAKQRKDNWITNMEECYRFAIPHRNTFYEQTPGQKKGNDIFDSTAVLGVPKFATKIQGMLLPPWRHFTQLVPGPDISKENRENSQFQEQLSEATNVMFSHVNHSNMASQVHEAFQDLAVGTGSYDIMGGQLGGPSLIFNAIPITELVLEEGPRSTIETSYREMCIPARNIDGTWSGCEITPELTKLVKDKPSARVDFVEAVVCDYDMRRWEGAVIHKPTKEVIWRASWATNPRIVFRWSVTPGEIYGRGPIMQMLADIKTANKVVEFILRNAAIAVSGMWTATTDAALNPYNFRPSPGAVIPVQSNDQRNPTIRALERSGDIGLGFEVLSQLQENIKRGLFQSLRDPTQAVPSATQVAIEDRDLVNEAGSSFGRLQTEVVEATASRITDVLSQQGKMPRIRIDGRLITLKHMSPLARAQDMDDVMALQKTIESVPPESVPIGIKIEDLAAWVAQKMGVDPTLIRDPAEREVKIAQAQQLLQQSQKAA